MKLRLIILSGCACLGIYSHARSTIVLTSGRYAVDTLMHTTLSTGIETTGITLSGLDQSNAKIKTNIFYTSADLQTPGLVLTGVQALDTEGGSESILSMGERKNRQDGLHYLAGVNGDHANLNGTFKRTNGPAYINGLLYNFGIGDDNWQMFQSFVTVEKENGITITDRVAIHLPIGFPDSQHHDIHINTPRNENYLVIYTPEYGTSTKTNCWGRECQMRLVNGSISAGDAIFEITSDWVGDCSGNASHGNMAIPADGYVLSGHGTPYGLMAQLYKGQRIGLHKPSFEIDGMPCDDVTTVIGGCPIILNGGNPITSAECTQLYNTTAIQITATARTAIGYDRDRTKLIMLVTDCYNTNGCTTGAKSNYGDSSSGLDFCTLAEIMAYLGCDTATAMDGGGSSQLYNRGHGICNIPYGQASYLRPVANGFFVAYDPSGDSGINEPGCDGTEANATYYNLQGQVIAHPHNGIFIKRQGSLTTKEYIP